MIKVILEAFSLLQSHHKLGIIRFQIVLLFMAFTEVLSIAMISQFISLILNIDQINDPSTLFGKVNYALGFDEAKSFISFIGVFVLSLLLLSAINATFSIRYIFRYAHRLGAELSIDLFSNYMKRDWIFYTKTNTSNLMNNTVGECSRVANQIIVPALNINSKILIVFAIFFYMVNVSWITTVIGFATFGLTYLLIFKLVRYRINQNGIKVSTLGEERLKLMNEGFGGIKDTILLNKSNAFISLFNKASFAIGRVQASSLTLFDIPKFWVELLAFGSIIILAMLLFFQSEQAFINMVPTLSVFIMGSYKLLPAFQQIYSNFSNIKSAQSALDNIKNDLITGNLEANDVTKPINLTNQKITLSNIAFIYPGKDISAIEDINLSINRNEMIGIVGHSGSGKSTLVDLILGFLEPSSGYLSIDDNKISSNNIYAWRELLGYVPQSIFLSDTSLKENIAFGERIDDIDNDSLMKAIQLSELEDLISKLPNGINTVVGERGVQLSGGQRQRIAIARALYRNPKILILDEATSALDGNTEKRIMESITSLSSKMTIIIVAHRINTVRNCNTIYLMENGKISDHGNYDELIRKNKSFEKLTKIS